MQELCLLDVEMYYSDACEKWCELAGSAREGESSVCVWDVNLQRSWILLGLSCFLALAVLRGHFVPGLQN